MRIGVGEPFHSTDKTVANLRSVAIPNSAGVAVLWEEIDANALREPFFAISLDGKNVDGVRATSYDLQLRYAQFDPAVGQPAVPPSLLADAGSELCIVQFVTQSLSAFRAGVESQGATIYDFLPNHAYIARVPAQTRPVVCANHGHCDDGAFCNGDETCLAGACVAGVAPCAADQSCDEDDDECEDEDDEDGDDDDGT